MLRSPSGSARIAGAYQRTRRAQRRITSRRNARRRHFYARNEGPRRCFTLNSAERLHSGSRLGILAAVSAEAIHASADPANVQELEHDARTAVAEWASIPARALALREYVRRFQQAYGQGLTIDGIWGRGTRHAASLISDVPEASLPPIQHPGSTSSTTTSSTSVPAKLAAAVELARWTAEAVAEDTTAASALRTLNTNASVRAVRSRSTLSGPLTIDEVPGGVIITHSTLGSVPVPADVRSSEATARASAIWARASAAGGRAAADLRAQADAAYQAGERALREVRRRIDGEVDGAGREALRLVEAGLVAILRPASTAIREATSGLSGPVLLLGAGLLAMFFLSKR